MNIHLFNKKMKHFYSHSELFVHSHYYARKILRLRIPTCDHQFYFYRSFLRRPKKITNTENGLSELNKKSVLVRVESGLIRNGDLYSHLDGLERFAFPFSTV